MAGRNRQEAKRLRDEAIIRGYDAAPDKWRVTLDEAIHWVASNHSEFTTDDVWDYLEENDFPIPAETRSMGGAMMRARVNGWARPTDRLANSARPICHARPMRVWESLVGGK